MFFLYILLGIVYSNLLEWIFHQHPLHSMHKLSRDQTSSLWFHMIHHKRVSVASYKDYHEVDKYLITDVISIIGLILIHYFICYVFMGWLGFFIGNFIGALLFLGVHIFSHYFPKFGKKWTRWHYDHHIHFPNYNWCVSFPLWDILLGTYKSAKSRPEITKPSSVTKRIL